MAKVSAFGFTNTTAGSHDVDQVALGLTTNYSKDVDANSCKLDNKTAPVDVQELIQLRSSIIDKTPTVANIQYPSRVKTSVKYGIRSDTVLSTTDTADASYRVDEPIVCTITFTHPRSGNITGTQVATVFQRAISTLMRADGTWRFDDLMRLSETPVVD